MSKNKKVTFKSTAILLGILILNSATKEVVGKEFAESLKYVDRATNEEHELKINGMFIEIGLSPRSELVKDLVKLNKIGEIEVRKVEVKAEELVKIPAYAVDKDSDSPRKYAISTKEAATSDLLQVAVQDMTKNYSEDLELKNIYFSDSAVYYEFNKKDLSEGFMQALQMVTEEIMGISEINFI